MKNTILVLTERKGDAFKKSTYEAVTKAAKLAGELGAEVVALYLGKSEPANLDRLAAFGAAKCLVGLDPNLENYHPELWAQAVVQAVAQSKADYVFASFGSLYKDLLPKVAVRLGTSVISDCTGLQCTNGTLTAQRPMYAGKVYATIPQGSAKPAMFNLRPNEFEAAENKAASFEKIALALKLDTSKATAKLVKVEAGKSEVPDLTEAPIIISGGRAMKARENFALLEELASLLNAPVGASRAACDAGYRDHSSQVGQTGKVVNPVFYMACGISGAIQHLAGMKTSKFIVAINTDPEAPIFKIANLGIVGDLFKIIPEVTKKLRATL